MFYTDDEIDAKIEEMRLELISTGEIIEDNLNYDYISKALKQARNSFDIINTINELDPYPYAYKMIYAYDTEFMYLGIIIYIKLEKDGEIIRFPKDVDTVYDIPKVADGNRNKTYTMINSKNYDYKRSLS